MANHFARAHVEHIRDWACEQIRLGGDYRDVARRAGYTFGAIYKWVKQKGVRRDVRRSGVRITPEEIARIRELKGQGLNNHQIQKALRVSQRTVEKYTGHVVQHRPPDVRQQAQEMYRSGKYRNRKEIAKALGATEHAVRKALYGLPPVPPWYDADPKVKENMLKLYNTGAYAKPELAEKLGLPLWWVDRHTRGIWPKGTRMERWDPWLKEQNRVAA